MPRPIDPFRLTGIALFCLIALSLIHLGLGLGLLWIGGEIAIMGGTWYYALAGLGLALAGGLGLLLRHWPAVALSGLVAGVTVLWSLAEIGAKGFMPSWGFDLAGRAGVPVGLFGLLLLTALFGTPRALAPGWFRPLGWGGIAAAVALPAILIALVWERSAPGNPAGAASLTPGAGHNAEGEWTGFGGSPLGARFTPATQITPENVGDLAEAWRFRTGDMGPQDGRVFYSAQNTPVYAGGRLFTCTPAAQVHALDPATGAEIWRYEAGVPASAMESMFSVACRSVGYYEGATADAEGLCAARVYVATADSRLTALDAATGAVCSGFGAGGTVDLAEGMGMQEVGFASSSSGPAVVGDVLVLGQQVSDNQRRDAPSGVVRAYDPDSGALLWAWDAKRQGIAAEPLAEGEVYPRGTPNVWNVISGDAGAGLVYIATGNPANDHWGGDRAPEEDRFTAAVVAIDIATGETVWDFATLRHDLWDYDLGAQPALIDLEIGGETRRALVQATKQGSIHVLDAATGESLYPVEMRPGPQGALPGDWTAEAQPQAVAFRNFAGHPGPDPEVLDPSHAWGVAMIDAALCRRDFMRMDYQGIYTPPSENPNGMLLHPGTVGGMNWGGVGLDLARGIVIANHSRLPNVVRMIPREEVDDLPVGEGGARPDQVVAPHWLSPYGVSRPMWLSVLETPCIAPPWGYLSASDLATGELLWSQPIGTGFDTGPMGLPTFLRIPLGTVTLGGPVVTATGLTFIGAAQDDWIRAYETETGRLVWSARLPAGGQASAMSYVHEGRQYVVLNAAGHDRIGSTPGDYIVAWALPM
ncbi:pyrroloquinoline quinone-dependent dehydrogenase [Pseudogemmobacter sonorensis]|uniref:pyrroloquinoline quinone-dependent dehydrogenase n=1 Tax=Pseudogemmobacter sonorensis TaxID=2989681 RepID=UPI003692CADC